MRITAPPGVKSTLVYDVNETSGNRIWDGVVAFGRVIFHKTVVATGWAALLHSTDGASWTETEITNLGGPSPSSPVDTLAMQPDGALPGDRLFIAESGAANAAIRAARADAVTGPFTIETLLAGNVGVTPDLGMGNPQDVDDPNLATSDVEAIQINTDASAPIQNPQKFLYQLGGPWAGSGNTALNVAVTAFARGIEYLLGAPFHTVYHDQSARLRKNASMDIENPVTGGTINYLRMWRGVVGADGKGSIDRLLSWQRTPLTMRSWDITQDPVPVPAPIIWAGQLQGQVSDMVIAGATLYILTLDDNGVTGTNIRLYKAVSPSQAPTLLGTIVQANTLVFSTRLVKLGNTFYVSSFVSGTNRVRVHKLVSNPASLDVRRGTRINV